MKTGEAILLLLLGSKNEKTLDELRARKYFDKLASQTKTAVEPENLGPTTDAAHQHILRMYRQIEEWKGNHLNEEKYGFKRTPRGFMPVEMTKKIVPPELLKIYEMRLIN